MFGNFPGHYLSAYRLSFMVPIVKRLPASWPDNYASTCRRSVTNRAFPRRKSPLSRRLVPSHFEKHAARLPAMVLENPRRWGSLNVCSPGRTSSRPSLIILGCILRRDVQKVAAKRTKVRGRGYRRGRKGVENAKEESAILLCQERENVEISLDPWEKFSTGVGSGG